MPALRIPHGRRRQPTLTALLLIKLALVPFAVWLASLAARRWGHAVSGYLGGFPMIGGPITLYLAVDYGADFAARSALVTMAAVAGQAGHMVAFSAAGRAAGALAGLAAGWTAYAVLSVGVGSLPLVPASALALAIAGLLLAARILPQPRDIATRPVIPPVEMWLRLAAALALAALILFGAATLGPTVSGILLSLPITGSIMPPFTLKLYGPDALARLQRGFITGLTGFTAFFFVVSVAVVPLGVVGAFTLATAAALATVGAFSRSSRSRA
ncbi:MAG: hypothetical protein IPP91_10020 [Betaproteobacteria bacterium]|nr:hypothetical protein [Betaproteobacteria bacterium]